MELGELLSRMLLSFQGPPRPVGGDSAPRAAPLGHEKGLFGRGPRDVAPLGGAYVWKLSRQVSLKAIGDREI